MISWGDVYKVAAAMVPLYVPLLLGFWSVRWWKMFTPAQCETVNTLVAFFATPFFTFGFAVHIDPFQANYRAIAADVISKLVVAAVIGAWVLLAGPGSRRRRDAASWSITTFSLSTLTSSLVVGVPMARAMYGDWAQQLVVQLSVFQAIVWITLLLFALEVRKAAAATQSAAADDDVPDSTAPAQERSQQQISDVETCTDGAAEKPAAALAQSPEIDASTPAEGVVPASGDGGRPSLCGLAKVVLCKLGRNPNTYASVVGVIWACIANRLKITLPIIVENSIGIMARCGNGLAMFSMGLFMAQQEKLIPCGPSLTFLGLALKFVLDPIAMSIGSIAVGLRGDVVRVAIIQAAVPQSITSFIFAKEYGLHPDVLSTAVIVGMVVSVPLIVSILYSTRRPLIKVKA